MDVHCASAKGVSCPWPYVLQEFSDLQQCACVRGIRACACVFAVMVGIPFRVRRSEPEAGKAGSAATRLAVVCAEEQAAELLVRVVAVFREDWWPVG